jgi:AcrR family transcriptional regulator
VARSKDQDKAASIIDAAFSVFGEEGYEATRVSHIAERAGVSSGTIYTYFKDKKDLFQATVMNGWETYVTRIRRLIEAYSTPEERLRQLVDMAFKTLKASLPLLRGMLFESSQMNLIERNIQSLCALVEELLQERADKPLLELEAVQRRATIRITVVGVLFSAALAKPSRLDAEIEALRNTVERIVWSRGRGPAAGARHQQLRPPASSKRTGVDT